MDLIYQNLLFYKVWEKKGKIIGIHIRRTATIEITHTHKSKRDKYFRQFVSALFGPFPFYDRLRHFNKLINPM